MNEGALLVYGGTRESRRGVQRPLVAAGYRVLLASSMAEAAKCLAGHEVRAIVMAYAPAGLDERGRERSAWLERGIPIIDVMSDDGPLQAGSMDIVLLDVVRNALAMPQTSALDEPAPR